jgi:hypothetical protein
MRLRSAFFALVLVAFVSCWFAVRAQQQPVPPPQAIVIAPDYLDTSQVADFAGQISQRSQKLKPMFQEVQPADWVAKGAPDAYIAQWQSLSEQNNAIVNDMAGITQTPEGLQQLLTALFRVHRFDGDLAVLLTAVRRYQTPPMADRLNSAVIGDQSAVDKLQQYALSLANEKEQRLAIEDSEAQRCRSQLAGQPPSRSSTSPRKTNSK